MKKDHIAIPADPADPEDGDVTQEGLERGRRARLIRMTRTKLGLSQHEFAARFRVPVGTLRDWEQSRSMAPNFAVAYIRVIEAQPELVATLVAWLRSGEPYCANCSHPPSPAGGRVGV